MIENAMQLVEAHLGDKPTGETPLQSQATTAPVVADALTPVAAAKKLKRTLKAKEKRIKSLEARLADPQADGVKTPYALRRLAVPGAVF